MQSQIASQRQGQGRSRVPEEALGFLELPLGGVVCGDVYSVGFCRHSSF